MGHMARVSRGDGIVASMDTPRTMNTATRTMTAVLCERCTQGAAGEQGHPALDFYVSGPYPGQSIFRCTDCDDRWIRHYGDTARFGWTRFELRASAKRA